MALQLIVPKTLKSGIEVYKRGRRRVSKAAYRAQQWRIRGGKAGTAARLKRQQGVESFMRAQLGAPPAAKSWQQIAGKYPERFADYLQDIQ